MVGRDLGYPRPAFAAWGSLCEASGSHGGRSFLEKVEVLISALPPPRAGRRGGRRSGLTGGVFPAEDSHPRLKSRQPHLHCAPCRPCLLHKELPRERPLLGNGAGREPLALHEWVEAVPQVRAWAGRDERACGASGPLPRWALPASAWCAVQGPQVPSS